MEKAHADFAKMSHQMTAALNTLVEVASDLRRMFGAMQAFNARTDARLTALVSRAGS